MKAAAANQQNWIEDDEQNVPLQAPVPIQDAPSTVEPSITPPPPLEASYEAQRRIYASLEQYLAGEW